MDVLHRIMRPAHCAIQHIIRRKSEHLHATLQSAKIRERPPQRSAESLGLFGFDV
jgi:hypothetical protein